MTCVSWSSVLDIVIIIAAVNCYCYCYYYYHCYYYYYYYYYFGVQSCATKSPNAKAPFAGGVAHRGTCLARCKPAPLHDLLWPCQLAPGWLGVGTLETLGPTKLQKPLLTTKVTLTTKFQLGVQSCATKSPNAKAPFAGGVAHRGTCLARCKPAPLHDLLWPCQLAPPFQPQFNGTSSTFMQLNLILSALAASSPPLHCGLWPFNLCGLWPPQPLCSVPSASVFYGYVWLTRTSAIFCEALATVTPSSR